MKKFIAGLALLYFVACKDKDALPKDIISRDQMESIIWDMMRATEFLNTYVFQKDSSLNRTIETQKWYEKIYTVHQTTRQEFEKSYSYYKTHPLLMRDVMDSIAKKQVNASSQEGAPPVALPATPPTTANADSVKKTPDTIIQPDSTTKLKMQKMMDTVRKRRVERKHH